MKDVTKTICKVWFSKLIHPVNRYLIKVSDKDTNHITFISDLEQVFVHGMVISALRDHLQILLVTLREFKWTILAPLPPPPVFLMIFG